jgi:hypothetical protein
LQIRKEEQRREEFEEKRRNFGVSLQKEQPKASPDSEKMVGKFADQFSKKYVDQWKYMESKETAVANRDRKESIPNIQVAPAVAQIIKEDPVQPKIQQQTNSLSENVVTESPTMEDILKNANMPAEMDNTNTGQPTMADLANMMGGLANLVASSASNSANMMQGLNNVNVAVEGMNRLPYHSTTKETSVFNA